MEEDVTQQLLLRHVRQLTEEVAELKNGETEPLTDNLAHWITAHFVVAAKKAASEAESGCIDLKTLRNLSADVVALRRGDHCADRLKIERERLDLDIRNSAENMEKRFDEWAKKPENKRKFCDSPLTPEEKGRRIREIFGRVDSPDHSPGLRPETLEIIEKAARIL